MSAEKELHPVLQYLKDNAVVVGLITVLVLSIGYFAISQASAGSSQPVSQPAAPEVSSVALEPETGDGGAGSEPGGAGGAPTPSTAPTGNPQRGEVPVVGKVPSGAASAAPEIVAGGAQQAVTEQDWRPMAEAFAAAWANTDGGKDAWMARLKPHATPSLIEAFAYTDISNIPSDKLSSVSSIEEASGTISFNAYFEDGGTLFQGLAVLRPDGSWLVDKVGPPRKK